MLRSIRSFVSASIATAIALSCFALPLLAETPRQCEARAYKEYELNLKNGMSYNQALYVLETSIASCPQPTSN